MKHKYNIYLNIDNQFIYSVVILTQIHSMFTVRVFRVVRGNAVVYVRMNGRNESWEFVSRRDRFEATLPRGYRWEYRRGWHTRAIYELGARATVKNKFSQGVITSPHVKEEIGEHRVKLGETRVMVGGARCIPLVVMYRSLFLTWKRWQIGE